MYKLALKNGGKTMISDLIVNISLLMSFTFIWHQLFRKVPLTFSSPLHIKILNGIIAGFLGVILMFYSIQVNEITILDLRHIPVILAAYYGGFIPTIISVIVITIGRFFIAVNFSSIVALFMMLTIAVGSSFISHFWKATPLKKWSLLLFYSQSIFLLAFYIVVNHFEQVLDIAIYHFISTIVGGYLTFYFDDYIRRNNERYYQYKEYSLLDSLTGLYNVRSFDYFYNEMLHEMVRDKQSCSICLIDIDYFKKINDTYGHAAGDEVLKQLAKLLKNLSRPIDKISRNGGEEFSILLPNCTVEQARNIAVRLCKAVQTYPFILPDQSKINITVSIGVAGINCDLREDVELSTELAKPLYQEADKALYKAKQNGRNIVCTTSDCIIK